MLRLVGRRLLATIPTLFGVLVVAFLLLNVVPGDPVAEMVGERADSATIEAICCPWNSSTIDLLMVASW